MMFFLFSFIMLRRVQYCCFIAIATVVSFSDCAARNVSCKLLLSVSGNSHMYTQFQNVLILRVRRKKKILSFLECLGCVCLCKKDLLEGHMRLFTVASKKPDLVPGPE